MTRPGSWPRVEPTDPALAWLADAVRPETDAFVTELGCRHCIQPVHVACFVEVVTTDFVSLDCRGGRLPRWARADRLRAPPCDPGRQARPLRASRRARAGPGARPQIRTACMRRVTPRGGDAWARELCATAPEEAALSVHPSAIRATCECETDGYTLCHSDLPFRSFDRRILGAQAIRTVLHDRGVVRDSLVKGVQDADRRCGSGGGRRPWWTRRWWGEWPRLARARTWGVRDGRPAQGCVAPGAVPAMRCSKRQGELCSSGRPTGEELLDALGRGDDLADAKG